MLKYENHFFDGEEWISVESDSKRFVVCGGKLFESLWMRVSEQKPCTEGDEIPEDDTIDEAEALEILLGGVT